MIRVIDNLLSLKVISNLAYTVFYQHSIVTICLSVCCTVSEIPVYSGRIMACHRDLGQGTQGSFNIDRIMHMSSFLSYIVTMIVLETRDTQKITMFSYPLLHNNIPSGLKKTVANIFALFLYNRADLWPIKRHRFGKKIPCLFTVYAHYRLIAGNAISISSAR